MIIVIFRECDIATATENCPFIVDLPDKNPVVFHYYVSLQMGMVRIDLWGVNQCKSQNSSDAFIYI